MTTHLYSVKRPAKELMKQVHDVRNYMPSFTMMESIVFDRSSTSFDVDVVCSVTSVSALDNSMEAMISIGALEDLDG